MSPILPIRVLVVDDEPYLCGLSKEFLEESKDMEVETVCSVAEARDDLRQKHYDAIVSDYQMPVEDGIQFLKSLRASGDRIPFILFTGKGREEVVIEALNNGANSYLQKGGKAAPQYAELESRIRAAVQERRSEEALRESESSLQRAEKVAGLGHWRLDVDTQMILSSDEAMSICGLDRQSMDYSEFMEVIESDYVPLLVESLKALIEEGKPYNIEIKIRRKSTGNDLDVHLRAEYSREKKVVFGTIQDITRRKRAEETSVEQESVLRDEAEEQLQRFPKMSIDLKGQAKTRLIHELQVHQIELETQAQQLRLVQMALEESRDKYRDLYEYAPLGYLTLTDKALVENANITSATLLRIGQNKLVGAHFSEFVAEEEADRWHLYFRNVLRLSEKQICALTLTRSDGSTFPARLESIRVIENSEGAATIRVAIVDITDIRQAEGALRECEVRFDHLAEHGGIVTWQVNTQGMFTYVNNASEAILGYRPEELVGKMHFYDLHSESGREAFKKSALEIFERREPFHDLVNSMLTKEGRTIWVATNGIPLLDEVGDLLGYEGSDTDITEHKQMEDALHESEERYRLIADNMVEVIVMLDLDLHVIYASPSIEDIFGYSAEEANAKDVSEIMTPRSLQVVMRAFDEAMMRETPHVNGSRPLLLLELEEYRKDGSTIWVSNSLTFAYNEANEPVAIISVARDITDRRKIEQALNEASKKLNLLNSITRHDITNQVMVLSGFLELCKLREKDPGLLEYLDKMRIAANNVQKQIAFTKEYQDIGVKAPAWASPGHQTAEAFAMLHPVGVELRDDTHAVELLADPLAEKVPHNLIDNSMRHGEHVSHIRICAKQTGDAMLIVYEDDGVGISFEDKKRLFEKGFGKNTGFGLFLTREILAITGITITETGKAGEGVRFEMLVPAGAWRRPSDGKLSH